MSVSKNRKVTLGIQARVILYHAKKEKGAYVKRWCFTLNNYTNQDVKFIRSNLDKTNANFAKVGKVGKDVGDSGTPHLRGFVHLKRRVRLATLKKILGVRVHAEVAKGTDLDNDKYCSKDGQIAVDIGQPSDQCSDR